MGRTRCRDLRQYWHQRNQNQVTLMTETRPTPVDGVLDVGQMLHVSAHGIGPGAAWVGDTAQTGNTALTQLARSLDALGIGLEVWDAQDRLMLYNQQVNRIHPDFHTPDHLGQTFQSLVRVHLKKQLLPSTAGRESQWLTHRQHPRGQTNTPLLQELAGKHWVQIHEANTPEGYLLSVRIDVTELVQQGKTLEATNHYLAEQSFTDGLTGLANRRRFDEALHIEWMRAARSVTPLSLLMVDIDYFKNYNDHYGHPAGDECLRRVASVLSRCVRRAGELVARYGGEEFVMLLPNADPTHARETAQNCLDEIGHEALVHAASSTRSTLTLSIGLATVLPDASLDPRRLINAADVAMYRAKTSGRARFEVATRADWDIDPNTPRTQPGAL